MDPKIDDGSRRWGRSPAVSGSNWDREAGEGVAEKRASLGARGVDICHTSIFHSRSCTGMGRSAGAWWRCPLALRSERKRRSYIKLGLYRYLSLVYKTYLYIITRLLYSLVYYIYYTFSRSDFRHRGSRKKGWGCFGARP